jgi:hypothetical protein
MGAWGPGSFENDSALDWADDLVQYNDLAWVVSTLEQAVDDYLIRYGDGFTDSATADNAIAAAEVVAALSGRPSEALPRVVIEWIHQHNLLVDTNIQALAIRVVNRALNTRELRDLWGEETDYDEWKRVVEDLKSRLQA